MEIERIYSEFLDFKNKDYKEKHKGLEKHFSASSAGSCYKKHLFKITDAPLKDFEERSQRIMRLGTLVHQDFEDAIKYYINNNTDKFATSSDGSGTGEPTQFYTKVDGKTDKVFFIEHRIHIPEYNIVGHLDFAVADKNNKDVYVYDYKTAASYKWSLKFGRKYKDKNPNFNYEMQLSTYLLGLQKHFEETIVDYLLSNIDVQDKYFIFVEHEVLSPELNVRGHLDFAYIDKENRHLTVIDFKSVGSFKWRGKFGHLKNRDKEPSFKYEMQLGTYALAMKNIYGKYISHSADNMELKIIWYNKDTSRMREEVIQSRFIEMAKSYWEELNEWRKEIENKDPELEDYNNVNETISRYREVGVPFQDWECKYCPYDHICK